MATTRILNGLTRIERHASILFRGRPFHRCFSASPAMSAHLRFEVRDSVGLVTFDSPGKVNTLSQAVMTEFAEIISKIESDPAVKSAVLISSKPDCFIAGADIPMLQACKTVEEMETLSKHAQTLLQKVEDCKKPVVAAIMGSCLGGGLEVALACHYRIAVKTSKTAMSTPEVLLGLLPGGGGTQRLPPLVSVPTALDMMLTGRNIRADKAKKLGLVDQLVDPLGPGINQADVRTRDYLEEIAINAAKGLADGSLKKTPKKKGLMDKVMDKLLSYEFGQNFVLNKAKGTVMKQTQGNYPAPLKIIEVVKTSLQKGKAEGYAAEARLFGELGMTKESEALIGLFHGQTACKKNPYGVPQKKVQTVAVLGAGLMGAGIAQVSLDKGMNVILKDMALPGLTRGQQQIEKGLKDSVKKKKMTQFEADCIMSNLDGTLTYENFHKTDMVIEAVFEDINIKHKVIKEVEAVVPEDCIIGTNTSAIAINEIAKASNRKDKIIGIHYFSPVPKMELVEVIVTEDTSKETIASTVDFCKRQGKTVITVKDSPLFYTSRCIAAYMGIGYVIALEGVDIARLDRLCLKAGCPIGVMALYDDVGLQVAAHVMNAGLEAFGDKMEPGIESAHQSLVNILNHGIQGRISGEGLYLYQNGKRQGPNPRTVELMKAYALQPEMPLTDDNIVERVIARFTLEAVRCLEEGVINSPLEGDVGLVFGTGYPPHLGGPFRYIDSIGADKFLSTLRRYEEYYEKEFVPCQLLIDYAKDNRKFHTR